MSLTSRKRLTIKASSPLPLRGLKEGSPKKKLASNILIALSCRSKTTGSEYTFHKIFIIGNRENRVLSKPFLNFHQPIILGYPFAAAGSAALNVIRS